MFQASRITDGTVYNNLNTAINGLYRHEAAADCISNIDEDKIFEPDFVSTKKGT